MRDGPSCVASGTRSLARLQKDAKSAWCVVYVNKAKIDKESTFFPFYKQFLEQTQNKYLDQFLSSKADINQLYAKQLISKVSRVQLHVG